MTILNLTLARAGKNTAAALLASSVLFAAGCANMETTATSTPLSASAVMTGRVHGGVNPVANSTVMLYAIGQNGNGSAPTLYAQATSANDGTGSFRFTKNPGNIPPANLPVNPGSSYQCPTGNYDPIMYIIAQGGNTTGNTTLQGINNTAAAFLAPVGQCSQITNATFVDVSEVTTVATVASAAQFINPNNDNIGSDGIGVAYQALFNAFKNVNNLVNVANGVANGTTTAAPVPGGSGVSGVTMTVTAPAATVNTIANILASCINQQSQTAANCTTLFANATAPSNAAHQSQPTLSYNPPIDTIQAALYMFLNPTNGSQAHRNNLFGLSAAAGAPFQPTLTAAPSDWLLPVTYTSNGTCGTTASSFFSHPFDMNIDFGGNLWIANKAGTNGALVEMSPSGQPAACVSVGGSAGGGGLVDINGTIWYTDSANNAIYAYAPPPTATVRTFTTAAPPLAITADGNGNIFFTTTTGTVGSVYEILNGASLSNVSNPVLITNTVGPNPARMFPDSALDIWVTSGANFVTELNFTTATGNVHNYLPVQYSVVGPTYGVMVGVVNNGSTVTNRIYVTSQDANSTMSVLTPTGTGSFVVSIVSSANSGGLLTPTGFWLDGSGGAWVGNSAADTSGLYSVSQLGPDTGSISPAGTNGGYQKPTTAINAARLTVVDPVGNVWILSDNLPNTITELVGAAVPIYAPYPNGLNNGRFQAIP